VIESNTENKIAFGCPLFAAIVSTLNDRKLVDSRQTGQQTVWQLPQTCRPFEAEIELPESRRLFKVRSNTASVYRHATLDSFLYADRLLIGPIARYVGLLDTLGLHLSLRAQQLMVQACMQFNNGRWREN
jgi:hypothetical protein